MLQYNTLHYLEYHGLQLELDLMVWKRGPFFKRRRINVLFIAVLEYDGNRNDEFLLAAKAFVEAYVTQVNVQVDEYRVYFAPLRSVHETMFIITPNGISRN